VKHVVEILFDNVHFNRDNPNVPSDIEMMPHLLKFIEQNGTLLSNNHTPLIAHTATRTASPPYTGLYGDRAGMPIGNSYQAYNTDGTTDPAESFAYWTDPIDDTPPPRTPVTTRTRRWCTARPGRDLVDDDSRPTPRRRPPGSPGPRAGCNVGEVATANMELENAPLDLSEVFGPNSPEIQQ